MGRTASHIWRVVATVILLLCAAQVCLAQLNENCTVSVLNHTVRVNPDGSWVLPNIPANFGQVKARATCVQNGVTTSGESDFFTVPANGAVNLPPIKMGVTTQVPASVGLSPASLSFDAAGQTTQLLVMAAYPDNSTKDVTAGGTGTNYTTSNPAIATVSADGLVTAVASGTVVIQATNDGASGIITANVALSGTDSDADGIPDDAEARLGLDPHNPVDAQEDFDRDNLTNLQEYQLGTDLRNHDGDGDGLNDGDEANKYHTSPFVADTDGDGIPDGVEVQTGSNPLDRNNYDLKKATAGSVLKPASFALTTSVLIPVASQQLSWKVNLIDGKTTLDLTADPRTNYSSSDLTVCNFGAQRGLVFAGNPGTCTITVSNNTLSVSASGTVQSFTPQALAFVDIPGFANNVDVSGNYAYVAAGSAGLQVVDVSDHSHPRVAATRSLPGNADDVMVVGNYAYVAAGNAGLQVVDISNPLSPAVAGSLNTGGEAWDVVVRSSRAYVANGVSGLVIIDVSTPSSPVRLGSLSLPGTSKGVDVDAVRQIAAVAMGPSGLAVVNVANPAAPSLLASLQGGDVRDLAISGNYVFLADFSRSFTSVDLTNPSQPALRASTSQSLGGLLQDVVVNGSIAAGADVFFVNGVPMIDVSNPASPQPRLILDFSPFRDDNGTGVAMDTSYVYLTAEAGNISENGVSGTTRLYIGQYRNVRDDLGIPPTVQITSPAPGAQVVQGSTLTITATATDDVAVAAVNFLVNGQPAFTTAAAPYQYSFTAPVVGPTLTIGATAVDFGGNVSQKASVTVNVIPDPGTTVVGKVVDVNQNGIPGATVTVNGGLSATTQNDGTFSISGVPSVAGSLVVTATATVNGLFLYGTSAGVPPVHGGTTNAGTILVRPKQYFYTNNDQIFFNNTVSAFSVNPDGTVSIIEGSPYQTGGLGGASYGGLLEDYIQFPIANRITVAGNFLFVSNARSANISVFNIDPDNGRLTLVPGSPFPTGMPFGSTSLAATPDNRFLYAATSRVGSIAVFNIGANGVLTPVPGSPFSAGGMPYGIKVSPDGKFLAATLYDRNAVTLFRIGSNGALTSAGAPIPATVLGNVAGLDINCRSNLLFVGGQSSDGTSVGVFSISPGGALTPVPGPSFINQGVDSNGFVLLNPADSILFDVNQGSSSVTVFNISPGGSLTPAPGSPFLINLSESESETYPPVRLATNAGHLLFIEWSFGGGVDSAGFTVYSVSSTGALTPVSYPFTGDDRTTSFTSLTAYPSKQCKQ